jgi:hypothetical protein
MNKTDFETITSKLEARINACDETLGLITEDNPIENITVAQLKAVKAFAVSEYPIQTNILLIDSYHVIGMGNLSAVQLGIFTKLIKRYAEYRPDLNAITKWDGNIDTLPKIPKRTKFKLLELGVELVSGRSGEIEEISEEADEISESTAVTKTEVNPETLVPVGKYDQVKGMIIVKPDELEAFTEFITHHKLFKTIQPEMMALKMRAQQAYCGIHWVYVENQYRGIPDKTSTKDSIRDFYNNFK